MWREKPAWSGRERCVDTLIAEAALDTTEKQLNRRLAMDNTSEPNRRTMLAATAAAGAYSLAASAAPGAAAPAPSATTGDNAIRPFSFHAPDEALVDLRRRI